MMYHLLGCAREGGWGQGRQGQSLQALCDVCGVCMLGRGVVKYIISKLIE